MNRLLLFILFCVVVGASVFVLTPRISSHAQLIDYFPETTTALVECDDLAIAFEKLQRFLAEKSPVKTKFIDIARHLSLPSDRFDEAGKFFGYLESVVRRLPQSSSFHTKAALALFPQSTGSAPTESISLAQHLVFALQVKEDFSWSIIQESLGTVHSQRTSVYQGETLVTLMLANGYTLTYWLHQDVLVCAPNITLIKRCIDQVLQGMIRTHFGFQLNDGYRQLKRYTNKQDSMSCFADLEKLQEWLPHLREFAVENWGLMPRNMALFYATSAKGEQGLRIAALTEKGALAAWMKQHQLAPPTIGLGSRQILPENEFVFWTNWFNLKQLWNVSLEYANSDIAALMTTLEQQVFEETGKSLEQYFNVVGSGAGVFINKETGQGPASRSLGCLAIEVRDRPTVELLLKKLLHGLQVVTVKSGDANISSVVLAGGLLQPAFTVDDTYLLLADSVELIEQILSQIKGDGGRERKGGRPADDATENLFLFIRTGEMVERLAPLLTMLSRENGEWNRVLSATSKQAVRETVLPLVIDLKGIATSRLRVSAAEDTILLEMNNVMRQP